MKPAPDFAFHFYGGLVMESFTVREVETGLRIAWEGFEVQVWATEEHDSRGKTNLVLPRERPQFWPRNQPRGSD